MNGFSMIDKLNIPGYHHPDEAGFLVILDRLKQATNTANERALFQALGLKANSVHVAMKKQVIQASWIMAAMIKFGASPNWLLLGNHRPMNEGDGVTVLPITTFDGEIEANKPGTAWFPFRRSWLDIKGPLEHMMLVKAEGDSMEPTINAGSLVLLNTGLKDINSDGVFALTYNQSLHLKRVQITPDKLILQSDNKLYKDIDIALIKGKPPKSISIIGRAINWWHEEKL